MKKPALILLASFLLTITFRVADLDGWDESFYLAQVVSAVQDGDLLLQNDLLKFPNPFLEKYRAISILDSNGAVLNCFSAGPGLFYSPVMIVLLKAGIPLKNPLTKNCLAIFALVIFALIIPALIRFVSELRQTNNHSVIAALIAIISTPFFVYGSRYYLASHFPGTVMVILAYLCWVRWLSNQQLRHVTLAGTFCGMVVLIRWQDILILFPLVTSYYFAVRTRSHGWLRGLPHFLLGFIPLCLVQLIAWKIQFNQWFIVPQGSSFMKWHSPDFVPFLFSGFHGVFLWSPGLILGLMGLFIAFKQAEKKSLRGFILGMIITWPLVFYVSASAQDWWAGSSCGPRRLTSLLPMVAVGLAGFASISKPKLRIAVSVALVAWMLITTSAFLAGIDDLSLISSKQTSQANPNSRIISDTEHSDMIAYGLKRLEKMVKPGFAWNNGNKHSDRLVGYLLSLCAVILSTVFWKRLILMRRVQMFIICFVLGWVSVTLGYLTIKVQSYRPWNAVWYQVVRGREISVPNEEAPKEFWEAAGVIRAVRAYRSHDISTANELKGILETFPYVSMDEIKTFGINPENKPLIDHPYLVER